MTIYISMVTWPRFQTFASAIADFLTPKIVHVEVPIEQLLSDAIAQAVSDSTFRQQLIDRPKPTLASLDIHLPDRQAVTVLESNSTATFLVLPIMTDREIAYLRSGLDSRRSQRALRSIIILKAWQDSDYKARLIADPQTVLIEAGLKLPAANNIQVLENNLDHFISSHSIGTLIASRSTQIYKI